MVIIELVMMILVFENVFLVIFGLVVVLLISEVVMLIVLCRFLVVCIWLGLNCLLVVSVRVLIFSVCGDLLWVMMMELNIGFSVVRMLFMFLLFSMLSILIRNWKLNLCVSVCVRVFVLVGLCVVLMNIVGVLCMCFNWLGLVMVVKLVWMVLLLS